MIISFFFLFLLNVLKTKEKDRKYEKMLYYINDKKVLVSNAPDLCQKEEYYKDDAFFEMHNKGSKLDTDIGEINFKAIGTKADYYF